MRQFATDYVRELLASFPDVSLPSVVRVRRTYAGHWQRSAGAWSWYLVDEEGRDLGIGSQYPVFQLRVGMIELDFGEYGISIDPLQGE